MLKRILKRIFKEVGFNVQRLKLDHPVTENPLPSKYSNVTFNASHRYDLIIFDDFLPNPLQSWRSSEVASYLKNYKNVNLLCMMNNYSKEGFIEDKDFERDRDLFLNQYNLPNHKLLIKNILTEELININASVVYCFFLNNLREIYFLLVKYQIPFIFTLYPGGGFRFYNEETDSFLKEINQSPLFRGVFVTQIGVKNYLIDRKVINEDKINFIYGGVLEVSKYKLTKEKLFFGKSKSTLDICFVAAKYSLHGIDKGFDVFCQIGHELSKRYSFIRFHVIGGFSRKDLLYEIPDSFIRFYGYQYFPWFQDFYSNIDIIISPVKSHVIAPGAFDGFPTGAVTDAGLFGVLMMTSDPLGDNNWPKFKNWEEIVLVDSNAHSIIHSIEKLLASPDLIRSISENGRIKLKELFSEKIQVGERIKFLNDKALNIK